MDCLWEFTVTKKRTMYNIFANEGEPAISCFKRFILNFESWSEGSRIEEQHYSKWLCCVWCVPMYTYFSHCYGRTQPSMAQMIERLISLSVSAICIGPSTVQLWFTVCSNAINWTWSVSASIEVDCIDTARPVLPTHPIAFFTSLIPNR